MVLRVVTEMPLCNSTKFVGPSGVMVPADRNKHLIENFFRFLGCCFSVVFHTTDRRGFLTLHESLLSSLRPYGSGPRCGPRRPSLNFGIPKPYDHHIPVMSVQKIDCLERNNTYSIPSIQTGFSPWVRRHRMASRTLPSNWKVFIAILLGNVPDQTR